MGQRQQVAIVTGGTKGLGKALSDFLRGKGWYVYVISRTCNDSEFLEQKKPDHITFDFASEELMVSIRNSIKHEHIDLLINNAGTAYSEEQNEETIETDYKKIFQTNFISPVKLVLSLRKKLIGGTVINISSDLSYLPVKKLALYAASKSALNTWFASYSQSEINIRFITIMPSMINTPMLKQLLGQAYLQLKEKMMDPAILAKKILSMVDDSSIKTGSEMFISHQNGSHTSQEILRNKTFFKLGDHI